MARQVIITGLGTVTAAGIGIEPLWQAVLAGESAMGLIEHFDAGGFDSQIGGTVYGLKANKVVPKHYRKATKVMSRDIELAVGSADCAARDANLTTPGTDPDQARSYSAQRTGVQVGAGLIAADINELAAAMATSKNDDGSLDMHAWGKEGITHLTPLWLLKYLPNMLACHLTIIHDAKGPSNTITCCEASGGLSIGESLRVIQRNAADLCFCGGAEHKLNMMGIFRQQLTGRLNSSDNDAPKRAIRPFDKTAAGTGIGEGGGIVTLEERSAANARGISGYAEIIGFGAGQTVYPEAGGLEPDPQGRGIVSAITSALNDAQITPDDIDMIIPFGSAIPVYDKVEIVALKHVFKSRLAEVPIWSSKPYVGNCFAGAGGIDVAIAAKSLAEQKVPARINCDAPLDDIDAGTSVAQDVKLDHVLVCSTSLGGQNAALILKRIA